MHLPIPEPEIGPADEHLTAFAGLMVATNLFNNALHVDLDDYLQPSRNGSQR